VIGDGNGAAGLRVTGTQVVGIGWAARLVGVS
jgi:hypothetical protein